MNGASGIALDAVINRPRYFFLRSVRPCMSMWLCLLAYWWLGRTSTLSPLYRACTSRLGTCYELTNSMPQPSWEANSGLDSQDMPACIEPIRSITVLTAACDICSPGLTNPNPCMLFVCRHVDPVQVVTVYKGSRNIAPLILTLSTGCLWVANVTLRLLYLPGKNPGTHWIGDWVGPRAVLGYLEKSEISFSDRDSNAESSSR